MPDGLVTIEEADSPNDFMFHHYLTNRKLPGNQAGGHAGRNQSALDSKKVTPRAMYHLKTYLVEDNPVIRESLIATLEELSPVVVVGTANDELTAVRWLSRPGQQADLVIVDIFLKSGSGLGVLRASGEFANHCTLVVLSNYATADVRRKCLELGAARVFDKSNEIDALIEYCGDLAAERDRSGGAPGNGSTA